MFSTLAIGTSILKWFKDRLTLKNILIVAGIAVIAFGQYKFHRWSFENGEEHNKKESAKEIAKITKERDSLQRRYTAYRGAFKTWVARSEAARKQLAAQNQVLIDGLELKLENAGKQKTTTRGLVNEIPRYIPATADYILPVGFVRLFNLSLEGEPGARSPDAFGFSESLTLDVGAPSGIALTTLAEVTTENNAECVYRGEVIRSWQTWYKETKQQFEKAQQDVIDSIPRVPGEDPVPATPPASLNETAAVTHESS